MLALTLLSLAASASAVVLPDAFNAPHAHLAKRAATDSAYLTSIFGLIQSDCTQSCSYATQDLTTCATLNSQEAIIACACSQTSLGDLRTCAACVSASSLTSTRNQTAVVNNYNSFVDLCSKNGLASVVGTVEVGQSTSSVRRTTLSGASSTRSASRTASATPTSRVTYNPTSTSVTQVVTVPSLIASGGVAAASSSNATSAGAAASATPTGAAGRVGATLAGVLGAVAVGMVVLA